MHGIKELAIFPEDVEIPLTTISKLWSATGGFDDFDTEELCTRLEQLVTRVALRSFDPTGPIARCCTYLS